MPDFAGDGGAAGAESRWRHRLGRSFVSADSYRLVLFLVAAVGKIISSMRPIRGERTGS